VRTKAEARIEDLYLIEGQAELVNGEIVRMPLHGGYVGYAIDTTKLSLYEYSERGERGWPLGSTVAYVVDLPHRKAFCPDLALYTGDDLSMKFPEGAPVFAAEFRDPDGYGPAAERKIKAKIEDYFAAGTQVVWDVDVLREGFVRVYRQSDAEHPTTYRRGEMAEAEPAVSGWTIPVDHLFYSQTDSISE